MSLFSGGHPDFFGLDIGTLGIRAVQLRGKNQPKNLAAYGLLNFDEPMTAIDSNADKQRLYLAIKELTKKVGISTKNVAVNLPSKRVFTTIVDVDKMSDAELEKSLRYQAGTFVPTPLAKSKIDWMVLGDSPAAAGKSEVLLTSVTTDFIEDRLAAVESAGLNVIAMEPDNIALARALVPFGATGSQMIIDIGNVSSDLVITIGEYPRLARSLPTGSAAIMRAASQNMAIEPSQAEQFVFKFGLVKDKLEGHVYNAIIGVVDSLILEMDKSIKFFQERYASVKLERITVTGAASVIPELPLYIANKFGIDVEIGNAWRNISVPASKQNELLAASNHFAVAAGLAERDS